MVHPVAGSEQGLEVRPHHRVDKQPPERVTPDTHGRVHTRPCARASAVFLWTTKAVAQGVGRVGFGRPFVPEGTLAPSGTAGGAVCGADDCNHG